jgi:DNA invertase Pin-like site-specific DNA recombinase
MLSVLAELQRELIVANTRDGLAAARARGRNGGRRPKLSPAQAVHAQQLYDGRQHTVAQIATPLSVPRTTVYGHLNRARNGPAGGEVHDRGWASRIPPATTAHGE